MKEEMNYKKKIVIAILGTVLLVGIAFFCYRTVEKAIVENEKESMKSLAEVNAQSLMTSLRAKSNLIYAALSGDMKDEADIQKGLLKVGERGQYIPLEELNRLEEWKRKECEEAGGRPGEVVCGPIRQSEEGYYVLYMTKAVYMKQSIAGYVQIELNLDEIYAQEQALSNLHLANGGYCIIKDAEGKTIMPSDKEEEEISLSQEEEDGILLAWTYKTEYGVPGKTEKLIACERIDIDGEELTLYIIEDYAQIIRPIERVAIYFCLLGMLILVWAGYFIYKVTAQQKEEALLKKELDHEKELNKANEALKNQEHLMQKYNHSKTMEVLTGAIAHEFNNLMTPIVLYTELMEENEVICREMPEEVSELGNAARRCEELARQLLNYSRQGRAEKVLTVYNATFAVRESVNIIRKLVPNYIELKINICETPYYVKGQIGSLNQILLNLMTNAAHAMSGGGTLTIQFGLSAESENVLRLIVEDTGSGIPQEIQRQVFQPFFTTKKEGEGTGIGLTVVKRLTEEHGGNIAVSTKEGKGTRFLLEIPRVMTEEAL